MKACPSAMACPPVTLSSTKACPSAMACPPVTLSSREVLWSSDRTKNTLSFYASLGGGGGGGSFLLCKSGGVFTFMQVCRAPPHPPNPFFCPCCQLRTQHHNSYPNEEMYSSLCTPEKSCPPRKSAIQGSPPIQWSPVIHWHNTEHLWIMEMPFNCT